MLDKDKNNTLHLAPESGSGDWGFGAATGNAGCKYPGRGYAERGYGERGYAGAKVARNRESALKRRTRTISS